MSYFYKSKSLNPYYNLAVEEFFVDLVSNSKEDLYILYFWQNADTIVIGRHQDARAECRLEKLEKENTKIARRKTGGGAVFHDKNNLNFSFIVPYKKFNKTRSMKIIENALKNLGQNAEISGRNDILINGKKISGNAYFDNKKAYLHHGTILIDTNIEKMTTLLNVDCEKLKINGVKSVKSRVLNLKEIAPEIDKNKIIKSIKNEFEKAYTKTLLKFIFTPENKKIIISKEKEFQNPEWVVGNNLKWDFETKEISNGQNLTIKGLKLPSGKFFYKVFSDSLDTKFIEKTERRLNKN